MKDDTATTEAAPVSLPVRPGTSHCGVVNVLQAAKLACFGVVTSRKHLKRQLISFAQLLTAQLVAAKSISLHWLVFKQVITALLVVTQSAVILAEF